MLRPPSSDPMVSICIRALRRPEGLRAAIASVLSQGVSDLEVVVSDDSGAMGHVVEAFADARLRYHANPSPQGSVANLRRVVELSRGRFVSVLDDDDRLLPGFLEAALEPFEQRPEVGLVFTGHLFEARGHRTRRHLGVAGGLQPSPLSMILEKTPLSKSATLMRREVWEEGERTFPVRDDSIADLTMWIRAALAGWGFWHVDEALAVIAIHARQMSWTAEMPDRYIHAFERFRFEDPDCERLRRARLAEARLGRARFHLRRGDLSGARREIGAARAVSPSGLGLHGWSLVAGIRPVVLRFALSRPGLAAAVMPVWQRWRPTVADMAGVPGRGRDRPRR